MNMMMTMIAAVPLAWSVETSRVQPVAFDAVRGETLALEASFKSYGTPLAMPTNGCCIMWQTNGMGSSWWMQPAEVERKVKARGEGEQWNGSTSSANCQLPTTNYIVKAAFTPSMDPGADTVIGFLGATGQNYRAAFRIRFRHGPGAVPGAIPLPTRTLDFATTTVLNPDDSPFMVKGGSGGISAQDAGTIATNVVAPVASAAAAAIAGKQNALTAGQMSAVNSGITSAKVAQYDLYEPLIIAKQSALNETQMDAVNSGITAAKVATYDGYATATATSIWNVAGTKFIDGGRDVYETVVPGVYSWTNDVKYGYIPAGLTFVEKTDPLDNDALWDAVKDGTEYHLTMNWTTGDYVRWQLYKGDGWDAPFARPYVVGHESDTVLSFADGSLKLYRKSADASIQKVGKLAMQGEAANIATNAAAAYFSANADYALTNLTGEAFTLRSGEIGNCETLTNLTLTLDFSAAGNRSGDCLLYVVHTNAEDHALAIWPNDLEVRGLGSDWLKIPKSSTNLFMFSRVKTGTVIVSRQEVK